MGYYKTELIELFNQEHIPFERKEHEAVYTMEEMEQQGLMQYGKVCKNLFLRNNNGKKHFLISVPGEKQVNLKELGVLLGGERLGFASENRLQKYLGVSHGSVSPLGVLNDETNSVQVILDSDILEWETIGVHPNDNTATIWLKPEDLKRLLEISGNSYVEMKI